MWTGLRPRNDLSAPRSRGLLGPLRPPQASPTVGPALAGIAPGKSVPGCISQPSAPRSRGLLLLPVQVTGAQPVGPALAGVAPSRPPWATARPRRPRARGDCSRLGGGEPAFDDASAPRSRGLLHPPPDYHLAARVGPALAGVAPGGRRRSGDGRARPGVHVAVGPALAGVAPPSSPSRSSPGSRPRARGGCSMGGEGEIEVDVSAPRSRGLLLPDERLAAGHAGRPRARGGCSFPVMVWDVSVASAPRSRGLLRGCGPVLYAAQVGPAFAGLLPCMVGPRRREPPGACRGALIVASRC